MKILLVLASLLLVVVAQAADRYKTIECQFSTSGYGLSATYLTVQKSSIMSAEMNSKSVFEVSISDSECEDSTTISIEESKDVAAYKAGRTFEAIVKHETPDVKIEGYAVCQQKK